MNSHHSKWSPHRMVRGLNTPAISPVSGSGNTVWSDFDPLQREQDQTKLLKSLVPPKLTGKTCSMLYGAT